MFHPTVAYGFSPIYQLWKKELRAITLKVKQLQVSFPSSFWWDWSWKMYECTAYGSKKKKKISPQWLIFWRWSKDLVVLCFKFRGSHKNTLPSYFQGSDFDNKLCLGANRPIPLPYLQSFTTHIRGSYICMYSGERFSISNSSWTIWLEL